MSLNQTRTISRDFSIVPIFLTFFFSFEKGWTRPYRGQWQSILMTHLFNFLCIMTHISSIQAFSDHQHRIDPPSIGRPSSKLHQFHIRQESGLEINEELAWAKLIHNSLWIHSRVWAWLSWREFWENMLRHGFQLF